MILYDNSGISLALSETTKHKCRAPPKFKQRLNIVIHSRKDPVMLTPNVHYTQCIGMTAVLLDLALILEDDDTT